MRISLLCDVDVLVVGASTAAVAAALEARNAKRSAMVVSDLAYLGEDVAGTLNLWPQGIDRADPLAAAIFEHTGDGPVAPTAVKGTLERTLAAADVRLMYLARPVAVLRNSAGRVAGVIIAARTSLFAVTCRAIVDATRFGTMLKLAGANLVTREAVAGCHWTIICDGEPHGLSLPAQQIVPPIRRKAKDTPKDFTAYQLHVDDPALVNDPIAVEHFLRASVISPNVVAVADIVQTAGPQRLAGAPVAGIKALTDAQLTVAPGLFAASSMLPLTNDAVATFERCDINIAIGRRAGKLAAAVPADQSQEFVAITGANPANAGQLGFAEAFLRQPQGHIELKSLAWPKLGTYDVVVAGGGTGGAPAAIAAARAGAKTLLLEIQRALGGVGTVGLITKYWFGNRVGFTDEIGALIAGIDPAAEAQKKNGWSPEVKAAVYQKLLRDAGGSAWLGGYAFGVRLDGSRINGLLVSSPLGCGLVETPAVVDATGNADIAAAAGAPCRLIDGRHVATQGTGLSPRVWPGVRYQNSDHTFVDETDAEGVTAALINSRAKFKNDFDVASLIDSRERRQIIGEYEISPLDIMAHRTFDDTVFTARSNFDTHGFIVHPLFMMVSPDHDPVSAHVPYRCMLPRGVDGVLVTGLGMSAHRDALPVIRMQADVQNQGYAAGLAAARCAQSGISFRQLDVKALQRDLVKVGVLAHDVPNHVDSFPLPKEKIDAAAAGDLGKVMNAAILIAHPRESQPLLLPIMKSDANPERRVDAALLLGLIGVAAAGETLAAAVKAAAWDNGWNYRGMGQFGASMSRLDAMIIALARTGASAGVPALVEKINQLDGAAQFSHCRAVAVATALLKSPELVSAIADLLAKSTMQGHAQTTVQEMFKHVNDDPCETEARNLSLRELYLARGLFVAGDHNGLGKKILEKYAMDIRGHYARHARAVLDAPTAHTGVEIA